MCARQPEAPQGAGAVRGVCAGVGAGVGAGERRCVAGGDPYSHPCFHRACVADGAPTVFLPPPGGESVRGSLPRVLLGRWRRCWGGAFASLALHMGLATLLFLGYSATLCPTVTCARMGAAGACGCVRHAGLVVGVRVNEDEGPDSASHRRSARTPPLRLWTASSRSLPSNRFDAERPRHSRALLDGLRCAAPRGASRDVVPAKQLRALHGCRG